MKKSGVKPHQVDEQVSRLVEGGPMRVGYGAEAQSVPEPSKGRCGTVSSRSFAHTAIRGAGGRA